MKKLKVLALSQLGSVPNYDHFYHELGKHVELDWRKLDRREQSNLKKYFRSVKINEYDRIFLDLRFKRTFKQRHYLATLPNIIEYEHDANQNYKPNGKYRGAWSKYYSSLSAFRAINSGFNVTNKLKSEGFDSVFVPKGYDETGIANYHLDRDIEVAFIGRTEHKAYDERKAFIESCSSELGLQLIRTEPGEEYNKMLNRIRFFVSADVGLGEYMGKNFEVMAAGCVLCAYRQGDREEEALGLKDMENVVLYSDVAELKGKLASLRDKPEVISSIAAQGQSLAEGNYSFSMIAKKTAEAMVAPTRVHRDLTLYDRVMAGLGR